MGITVTTTTEAGEGPSGARGAVAFATDHNLVLTSCNVSDFARIPFQVEPFGFNHSDTQIPQRLTAVTESCLAEYPAGVLAGSTLSHTCRTLCLPA